MKFKNARSFLAKCGVFSIVTVTAATFMTACSFQFGNLSENRYDLEDTTTEMFVGMISETVDDVNFSDEKEVESMSHTVSVIAEEYAITEGLEFQKANLVRVVDGDTIVVDIEGDGSYKVRLIGINTPESVATEEYLERTGKENTSEGTAASDYTKQVLSDTDLLYLQKDVSDTDQYGRLLRYVWLEVPDDEYNLDEISTKMLNGILVSEKVAEPAVYEPDTMYAEEFEELFNR